ncbi:hypothetical protein SCHIN_v1c11480 [Spiroplasma chinense]|uniref:Uncharacterized protein n=1 Tax=Spiroplasma chinense TaxID=216932 RepID=A0A5B9Y5M9_9MOLU|nr:hypothetical protein [Spiroplasma chinense]QEH62341.1 hypothetical protein SCHIN_v1c11480 [Spiroplasma chinense]
MRSFLVCTKYSAKTVLFSKPFWIANLVAFSFFTIFNTVANSLILKNNLTDFSFAQIHTVNYCMLWVHFGIIGIIFMYDFFWTQRTNGIKMMEIKSGLKPYQIFLAKIFVVTALIVTIILFYATYIVVLTSIYFSSNNNIVNTFTINLYSLLYLSLIVPSIALLLSVLNLKKAVLIVCSIIISLLALSPTLAEMFFSPVRLKAKNSNSGGSDFNLSGGANSIYFHYLYKKLKTDSSLEVIFNEIENITKNIDMMKETIHLENEEGLNDFQQNYYRKTIDYLKRIDFYKVGVDVEIIDFINKINFKLLPSAYKEIKYTKPNLTTVQEQLLNTKQSKRNQKNIGAYNYFNSHDVVKEVEEFANLFENNLDSNKKEWKKVNKKIVDTFKKDFYFKGTSWHINSMGLFFPIDWSIVNENSGILPKYNDPFELDLLIRDDWVDSVGKKKYQSALFKMMNQKSIMSKQNTPETYYATKPERMGIYLNPVMWFDVSRAFGFISLDFETVVLAQTHGLFNTYNFYKVDYEFVEDIESLIQEIKILSYNYTGPSRGVLYSITLFIPFLIIAGSYFIYRKNIYK